jgi:hypothetical protein
MEDGKWASGTVKTGSRIEIIPARGMSRKKEMGRLTGRTAEI